MNTCSFADSSIDMDEYLPDVTLKWCQDQLTTFGWARGEIDPSGYETSVQMRHHELAYRQLRQKLRERFDSGEVLSETLPPYGGVGWKPDITQVVRDVYNDVAKESDFQNETIFENDGVDENAEDSDLKEEVD
jgi:hypothetical protein